MTPAVYWRIPHCICFNYVNVCGSVLQKDNPNKQYSAFLLIISQQLGINILYLSNMSEKFTFEDMAPWPTNFWRLAIVSTSITTNSVKFLQEQRVPNGYLQNWVAPISATCAEFGSMMWTTFVTRCTTQTWPMPPNWWAKFFGKHTTESLQIGTISTLNVNL